MKRIERGDALLQPLLDLRPFLARDGARNDVQRPGAVDRAFLLVIHGEGDSHRLDRKLRRLLAHADFLAAQLGQVAHQRPTGSASAAARADQLVVVSRGGVGSPVDAHWRGMLRGIDAPNIPAREREQFKHAMNLPRIGAYRGCRSNLVRNGMRVPPPYTVPVLLPRIGVGGRPCRSMLRSITSRTIAMTGSSRWVPRCVRLRPAPHCRTRILAYSLSVEPAKHFINWQQDPQANYLARLTFPDKTRELRIEVDLVAEMAVFNPFDFFLEPYAQQFPFNYEAGEARELAPVPELHCRSRRVLRAIPGESIPRSAGRHRRLPRRPEHAAVARHPLPDPHGAGRADSGGDAGERLRLVPRLELAAGAAAAAPGARRALRLGLPHPAHSPM